MKVGNIEISQTGPFVLMAGPCQIESLDHARMMADALVKITSAHSVPFIYKSSFDKANRTSLDGKRGIGMDEGLKILSTIRKEFDVPVMTDIHNEAQCAIVAEVADLLQVPAFLSRQTDLLLAAGEAGKPVMVKKGQFLAPEDMRFVADKIASTGNENIMLCERGTSFGYHNLVNDFRGLEIMSNIGYPVVYDATHSTQSLGGANGKSGGQREYAPILARAALAVGVAGLFVEVHQDPDQAPSDGPAMIDLKMLEKSLPIWCSIDKLIKS